MNCSRFLKCNIDSHIEFCLVLKHKTCSSKGKRLLIIHFNTFVWKIGSTFEKIYTLMRNSVLMEDKIIMSLIQIGNGNGLQLVNDMFEVDKSIISMIMKELYFCKITKKKNPPFFWALLEIYASISPWITIKMPTSKCFQFTPLPFVLSN